MHITVIIGCLILACILSADVEAQKSEEFIRLLSKQMEVDCRTHNLTFNRVVFTPNGAEYHPIQTINGPGIPDIIIAEFLLGIDQQTYIRYDDDPNTPLPEGILGYHILGCGDNYLDINGDTWYWRGMELVLADELLDDPEDTELPTPTSTPHTTTVTRMHPSIVVLILVLLAAALLLILARLRVVDQIVRIGKRVRRRRK